MTTSVNSTGSVSSAGIGSGLDVNSIISKLMEVENKPLTHLQTTASSIQTTISAYGAVKSAVAGFRDAALALTRPSTWSATTGASADPTAVGVSAGSGAAAGSYAIVVGNLAAAQSTVSATYASRTDLVGAGNLHIDLAGAGGFADPSASGIDVTLTNTDTLASLADKINVAGGGVAASVVTDATGARLVLSASATGLPGAFRVAGTDSGGGTGLAALSFDPRAATPGATTQTQAARNAAVTVNGLPVTSASNTLDNVLPGMTLTLMKPGATPIQVSVAQDSASIKTAIGSFVSAYNAMATLIGEDVKYDAATQIAGPLQADSTAVSLQRQLRDILGSSSTASSVFGTLSQAGLQVQADGTLKVNDSALSSALGNVAELKKMFAATNGGTGSNSGFAQQFRALGDTVLGSTGLLTSRVTGLNKSLQKNRTDQDRLSDRLAGTEARLRKQYTALDTKMAGISTLSTYITQQIANWNKKDG